MTKKSRRSLYMERSPHRIHNFLTATDSAVVAVDPEMDERRLPHALLMERSPYCLPQNFPIDSEVVAVDPEMDYYNKNIGEAGGSFIIDR